MFYTFRQNNSGGEWAKDMPIYAIVEADSADEANSRAERVGLYFYGTEYGGQDCPCCGARWYPAINGGWDVQEFPSIYGEPAETYVSKWADYEHCTIYYKDGTTKSGTVPHDPNKT